jgi:hypothetical protein
MSYLTWSPDSRHVFAITGNDRPGYSDIMLDGRMMIGGWGARGNIGIPKFSPDGNHLFFTNYWRESNGQMITNTWKDGVYLRQYWGNINSVQFSPDSRHLGYTFTDRGHEGFWEDGRTFTCQKVRNFAYSSNSLYFSVDAFDGKQWRPLTFKA